MKIKVSEASGTVLDWLVAKCEGVPVEAEWFSWPIGNWVYSYSRDWSLAGPIIEREGIDLNYSNHEGTSGEVWDAACEPDRVFGGPTPLIAAMRCYCYAKLGDEIDIPEELCQQQSS